MMHWRYPIARQCVGRRGACIPRCEKISKSSSPCEFKFVRPTDNQNQKLKLDILKILLAEKLNPLSLDLRNFVIAYAPITPPPQPSDERPPYTHGDLDLAGFGQIKPLSSSPAPHDKELSSLVVLKPYRHQGLGCQLVEQLLQRASPAPNNVYLITVNKRRNFYERCGFQKVDDRTMPATLRVEKLLGTPIALAFAQDTLIVMRYIDSS